MAYSLIDVNFYNKSLGLVHYNKFKYNYFNSLTMTRIIIKHKAC